MGARDDFWEDHSDRIALDDYSARPLTRKEKKLQKQAAILRDKQLKEAEKQERKYARIEKKRAEKQAEIDRREEARLQKEEERQRRFQQKYASKHRYLDAQDDFLQTDPDDEEYFADLVNTMEQARANGNARALATENAKKRKDGDASRMAAGHNVGSKKSSGAVSSGKPMTKPSATKPALSKQSVTKASKGKQSKEKSLSAQESIPYLEMGRDGICRVTEKLYSKTIRFYDINYQLAQNEDKNAIFENWCDFLNYFDSTIHFQLSFVNHKTNLREFEQIISIKPQYDDFDDVRMEYAQMLKNQLAKGNNGLTKTKYITFAVEADTIREARPKLERIEADILNNFKVLGVQAYPLNGVERLQILYETFNPNQNNPFTFQYDQLVRSGLSTKDYVAPTSFTFNNGKHFMMGDTIGAASYLQILAPELTDKMLAEFLDMDKNLIVNLHIQSLDQLKAIKLVKSKVTDINKMKIEEQKKAVRSGYDMDIIPSDLMSYGEEAKRLLEDLQSRNERLFLVTVVFLNTAKTKQELDNVVFQTSGIAQKYNCALRRLDYMQEQGLMSSIPLGYNQIPIKRALTTTATAIFVPFTTQELFMEGESLYYGLNALSSNMIMVDRKKLKNPNGLILGTPGSGKSFSAKREITNAFFVTKDDIIICDPEGEYYPLVHKLGGQVIHIAPTSHDYINPMDINLDYSDDDNPLGFKSDFILSLCELIMGSRSGIEAEEKSVIDRCLPIVYQKYFEKPIPENMPVLGDLYETLRSQKEPQAQRIATALEIYVNGSLKVFNHQTNVQLDNRIICFDIKDLGKQLKKLGMLIVQDQVWNRVTINRFSSKSTRYYVDEFHLLLKEEQTAAYSVEIWKRFRKWGGIPTGITQNIKDLLASREIENIFENSDFIYMLNQASGDRQILAKQLNISPYQLSYVTNSGEGEGLLFYGNIIIPFKDRFDKSLKLYALMTTKPEEVERRKEAEALAAEREAAQVKKEANPYEEVVEIIDFDNEQEEPTIQENGKKAIRSLKEVPEYEDDYWLDDEEDEENPEEEISPDSPVREPVVVVSDSADEITAEDHPDDSEVTFPAVTDASGESENRNDLKQTIEEMDAQIKEYEELMKMTEELETRMRAWIAARDKKNS